MDDFVNTENIARYRRLIAISEADPSRDEGRHKILLRLLAEEQDKQSMPKESSLYAKR